MSNFQNKFETYYNDNMRAEMEALATTHAASDPQIFFEKASNLAYQKLMSNPITSKCQVTCGPDSEHAGTCYKITVTKGDKVWEKCCGHAHSHSH